MLCTYATRCHDYVPVLECGRSEDKSVLCLWCWVSVAFRPVSKFDLIVAGSHYKVLSPAGLAQLENIVDSLMRPRVVILDWLLMIC